MATESGDSKNTTNNQKRFTFYGMQLTRLELEGEVASLRYYADEELRIGQDGSDRIVRSYTSMADLGDSILAADSYIEGYLEVEGLKT